MDKNYAEEMARFGCKAWPGANAATKYGFAPEGEKKVEFRLHDNVIAVYERMVFAPGDVVFRLSVTGAGYPTAVTARRLTELLGGFDVSVCVKREAGRLLVGGVDATDTFVDVWLSREPAPLK